jgi:septum formation protein
MAQTRRLILASTSKYRKQLLDRLGLAFETAAPGVDETPLAGEAPAGTALRLAIEKSKSLKDKFKGCLIIGSDQVASSGGVVYGKPGDHANAVRQLRSLSGRAADFHTAVSLFDAASGAVDSRVVPCRVVFRTLSDDVIEAYLRREQPYDTSASAKAESLGIALIARIETDDPSSLVGLPLIALTEMLGRAGLPVLP